MTLEQLKQGKEIQEKIRTISNHIETITANPMATIGYINGHEEEKRAFYTKEFHEKMNNQAIEALKKIRIKLKEDFKQI